MALTTLSGLVAALPGQISRFAVPSSSSKIWNSFFELGTYPLVGSNATAIGSGGDIPTSATVGAMDLRNAGSGNQLYLYMMKASMNLSPVKAILYDRLWHASGVVGNVTTPQAVTSPGALTRPDSNGYDAELWLEINTGWGGTATVVTATYTDPVNGGSRSATCTVGTNLALTQGIMWPFTLQSGDTGVTSVQSVSLTPSTGTAGNASLVILRRIGMLVIDNQNVPTRSDYLLNSLAPIYNGACVNLMTMQNNGGNQPGEIMVQVIEG